MLSGTQKMCLRRRGEVWTGAQRAERKKTEAVGGEIRIFAKELFLRGIMSTRWQNSFVMCCYKGCTKRIPQLR